MDIFGKKKKHRFLDGYIEGPLAHHPFATSTQKENEYFMQWVHPIKLHRVSLRTPLGYRITHGFAEDVWNNNLAIKIHGNVPLSEQISRTLVAYLKTRSWFYEMEKLTGFLKEQGEASLLLYFDEDIGDMSNFETPVSINEEILEVEAFNRLKYDIIQWDDDGEPLMYSFHFDRQGPVKGTSTRVHASRVMRLVDKNLWRRETGHSILEVVYDSIVIITNIMKGAGEAAYRWGTGHPLILTKDLTDDQSVEKMKNLIGTPTRRSWHILPSEYIDSFTMIGQAGQMLNLKSLADMVIDQIVSASGIPRPILLGEVAGVVTGSEVNERSYFALLDKEHTNLEPFVRRYFTRDINIRKLLNGIPEWEIDWGLREVLSKREAIEYEQKKTSNALALTSIITVNEAREKIGMAPIPDEAGGDIIFGLASMYAPESTSSEQSAAGTEKQKNADQNQKERVKDADNPKEIIRDLVDGLRGKYSIDEISDMLGISRNTVYKLIEE